MAKHFQNKSTTKIENVKEKLPFLLEVLLFSCYNEFPHWEKQKLLPLRAYHHLMAVIKAAIATSASIISFAISKTVAKAPRPMPRCFCFTEILSP